MTLKNSKGTVYYGMHMYPGVAEYKDLGGLRVLVNEDAIRAMGPTFAGRPVFVKHRDEVTPDLDKLRGEADGWVIESFFNEADGKHWVKFLVCSEKGEKAIASGYRLSNCYAPKSFGPGGECNGVPYNKEVTGGEYEHLAIVPDPRYEDSVVMTPEQFKAYNESKKIELTRLANNNSGGTPVKLNLFRKVKVEKLENSADVAELIVVLPKSGREVSVQTLANEADDAEEKKKAPQMANAEHRVKVGEGDEAKEMSVGELVHAYNEMCAGQKQMENTDAVGDDPGDGELTNDDDDFVPAVESAQIAGTNSADDSGAKASDDDDEKPVDDAKKHKNAKTEADKAKAKEKADRLRNAHTRGNAEDYAPPPVATFDPTAKIQRGIARYGS